MNEFENREPIIPASLQEAFWLVSADMGYGHQRAIYPLRGLSRNGIILNANISKASKPSERRLWKRSLKFYERLSRAQQIPFLGKYFTRILDKLLFIPQYYPFKDYSEPTFQVRLLQRSIKKGLCHGVVSEIQNPELPLITSFYSSAIAAEMAGHRFVFCIICDTDMNRVWVAEKARETRIIYFAPNGTSAQRLFSYGVPQRNILVTGFPLPLELLGNRELSVLKSDLGKRLGRLDPRGMFHALYHHSIDAFLSKSYKPIHPELPPPLTITYVVGGAGAQKEIALKIAKSLKKKIKNGHAALNLVAGTRTEVRDYFQKIRTEVLNDHQNVTIVWAETNEAYFDAFNKILHTTDVLWTKPSELSFYCALGIPIIMTPAIGPQEKCNRRWLREIGAGIKQGKPKHTNQWLFELYRKGRLADAAWNGFLKGRKYGTFNILDFLEHGAFEHSNNPCKR